MALAIPNIVARTARRRKREMQRVEHIDSGNQGVTLGRYLGCVIANSART